MTEQNDTDEWGIDRRTVLKGVGAASVTGFVGLPAVSGGVAAANGTETMTVRSGTSSTVTGYRAGDDTGSFPVSEPNETADLTWIHPNWDGTSHDFDDGTRWIWHCDENTSTGQTVGGESTYYVKEPIAGDVVELEDTFDVPGTPVGGTLYITADNGYEVSLNGTSVGSAQVFDSGGTEWEDSDLGQEFVNAQSGSWMSVEEFDVSSLLVDGSNTLTVLGANEQQSTEDGEQNGTVTSNPGGVIYELDIEYETCIPCDLEETLKYEYVFEEDGADEDSEPDKDGFYPDDGGDAFGYLGYESKGKEYYEPVSVSFGNPENYCLDSFEVTVKAGPETGTVEPSQDDDGNLVVSIEDNEDFFHPKNGKPYAISYIEFDCVDPDY